MTAPETETPPPLPESAPTPAPDRSFLRFEPSAPAWWYILRMGAIAFTGAMAVIILIGPLIEDDGIYDEVVGDNPYLFAILAIALAPFLETFIMALFFFIAKFVTKNTVRLSIASAVCWGLLHTYNAPVNGLAVVWPFYILSRAYLAWRPLGFWKAYAVTALIHMTHNMIPALLIILTAG